MVANDPPIVHVCRIDSSFGGAVQVYQLPPTQILGLQDGSDVPASLDTPAANTFTSNRVCEFLDDRYLLLENNGVYKKNQGGPGNWGNVFSPTPLINKLSGLVVLHPDGVPTLAFMWYEDDEGAGAGSGGDQLIAFTTNGVNWVTRVTRSLNNLDQPDSVGEAIVFKRAVFWAHQHEDPVDAFNRVSIGSHDIELNASTSFVLFDQSCSGSDIALVVHKNKLFAWGVRDNDFAADGFRYELRRLLSSGGFGTHDQHIHVESDSGGGNYPSSSHRGHAAMFTDPTSGQLIVIASGGPSTGITLATSGGAKVLRFENADTDAFDSNAGIDISSTVMGDLGNPTGAGGADRYLFGGSQANVNNLFHVVIDNQTAPGVPARVFIWIARLSTFTECWEWKGINAEMEPVAGLVGIRLNEFVISSIVTGGGQYYPRLGAVELEGLPQEVMGGTKFEFRGRGSSALGTTTFYSNADQHAPVTEVPIVPGSLVVGAGMLTDLEAYYHLDTDGADSSGNGLDLNQTGSPLFAGTGIFGNAFDAPGTDGTFLSRAGDDASLDIGLSLAPFTVQAWVDIDAFSNPQNVISKGDGTTDGWYLQILTDASFRWFQFPSLDVSSAPGVIAGGTNGYQHILATSDGVTTRIYVDAVEVASQPSVAVVDTASPLHIGNIVTTGQAVDGRIDEPAVWSRHMTPAEVTSLYNAGVGKLLTEPTGLPTTPSIVGNTIINMVPDNGATLYSVILNPIGIPEGTTGTIVANLVV